jgi:L-lysine exporter family protein LysE/ArgO
MGQYFAGLALGLALIMPFGPLNVFILNEGLRVGMPRALLVVGVAGVCDSLLIVVGWKSMATVLERSSVSQGVLLAAGVVFLTYVGMRALTASGNGNGDVVVGAPVAIARKTAALSLLNPHAVLETVGVIGAAIAAQEATERTAFAGGIVTASWLWFLVLAVGAAALRRRLSIGMRLRVERVSGFLMLGLAALFARDLLHLVF